MGRISASGSIDLNLDTCKRERASLKTLHRPGKWVDLNKILKDKDNNTNRLTRYIIWGSLLDCLLRTKTNASLSQLNITDLFCSLFPHNSNANIIGYSSLTVIFISSQLSSHSP